MVVAVAQMTHAEAVYQVARLGGYVHAQGTTTAGSTTSGTDATNQRTPVANANLITGKFFWGRSGDAIGQGDELTSYATIGVMTWNTAGTSPGSNTSWALMSINPDLIIEALTDVQRKAAFTHAQAHPSLAIITNNLLNSSGVFEEWTSGTTSPPDGWEAASNANILQLTSSSTPQRVSSSFAMQVTDTSSGTGFIDYIVPKKHYLRLESVSLRALGVLAQNAATTGRVQIRVTDTPNTTTTQEYDNDQTGERWQELHDLNTASFALPSTINDLRLRVLARSTGGETQVDDLLLHGGPAITDYDLPNTLIGAERNILMENGYRTGQYTARLQFGRGWTFVRDFDGTPQIRLASSGHGGIPTGRHLWINGYKAPTVVTSGSTNVEVDPEFLTRAAAIQVLSQGSRNSESREIEAWGRLAELKAWMLQPENQRHVNPNRDKQIIWALAR